MRGVRRLPPRTGWGGATWWGRRWPPRRRRRRRALSFLAGGVGTGGAAAEQLVPPAAPAVCGAATAAAGGRAREHWPAILAGATAAGDVCAPSLGAAAGYASAPCSQCRLQCTLRPTRVRSPLRTSVCPAVLWWDARLIAFSPPAAAAADRWRQRCRLPPGRRAHGSLRAAAQPGPGRGIQRGDGLPQRPPARGQQRSCHRT
mmetsp:Transcript_18218/g.54806  ORF Transcript_18218/g.54806 Transcript_18218/m.54806 type:complete len:202 (+) Transcript_18218:3298-3903(+)